MNQGRIGSTVGTRSGQFVHALEFQRRMCIATQFRRRLCRATHTAAQAQVHRVSTNMQSNLR